MFCSLKNSKIVMRQAEKMLFESNLHQPVTHTHTCTEHTQPVPNHTSTDPALRSVQSPHTQTHTYALSFFTRRV